MWPFMFFFLLSTLVYTFLHIASWEKLVLGNTNDHNISPAPNELHWTSPGKGCSCQTDISFRKCSVPPLITPSPSFGKSVII